MAISPLLLQLAALPSVNAASRPHVEHVSVGGLRGDLLASHAQDLALALVELPAARASTDR